MGFWVVSKASVHLPGPLADLNSQSTVTVQRGFHPVGFFHLPPSHIDTALTCLERTISYPPMHCWSWSSNTLATWCEELTHWKRPWCWERLKVGGEGDDRGWDGWMASPTRWTWVWASAGSWWWTGRPGVLQSMVLRRVGHDWATELNWTEPESRILRAVLHCCSGFTIAWFCDMTSYFMLSNHCFLICNMKAVIHPLFSYRIHREEKKMRWQWKLSMKI